ncbi:MAG: DUF5676 family membrane protein [Desulfobacterales bacterium]|nr:DUF5676 family membrane protein [Desulfobacterales bacterium]
MEVIRIRKFGLACGSTAALLYLGCVFVMWTIGRQGSILFFNSLMHGIDVSSIIRTEMPWWEMIMGLVEIFILGWLTGATIAGIYNFGADRQKKSTQARET